MNNVALWHTARQFDKRSTKSIVDGLLEGRLNLGSRIFQPRWLPIIEGDLQLTVLSLYGKSLPETHRLTYKAGLKHLSLDTMTKLTIDGGGTDLRTLELKSIRQLSIRSLPPALKELTIRWCKLDQLPELPKSLSTLYLTGVSGLKKLPTLHEGMRHLTVTHTDIKLDVDTMPQSMKNFTTDKPVQGDVSAWVSCATYTCDPDLADPYHYMYSFARQLTSTGTFYGGRLDTNYTMAYSPIPCPKNFMRKSVSV